MCDAEDFAQRRVMLCSFFGGMGCGVSGGFFVCFGLLSGFWYIGA